jgi:primosomal protein N' (replication factor Y)
MADELESILHRVSPLCYNAFGSTNLAEVRTNLREVSVHCGGPDEGAVVAGEAHAYAAVALNVPVDKLFHYRVPEPLREALTAGARVRVPFGRREMTGYCVGFAETPDVEAARVKDILRVLDRPAILDERMLRLTRWMAEYYCCSWGAALDAALPSGVKKGSAARTVLMVSAARPAEELRARAAELEARAPRQARALRALAATEGEITASDLAGLAEVDHGVLWRLCRAGHLTRRKEKMPDDPSLEFRVERAEPPVLTPEQRAALDRIGAALDRGRFHVALLHGVTASGKTEIYLQALGLCVAAGRQGIVLVPEIALTPQTVARFRARFDRVCVLHSEMTERGRREQWMAIRAGKADVVIGARSAVFAPVPNLGLLVVDEEHEPSFKQENTPRYHGRDAGIWRARQENALVILGSATPSLESLYNARAGKYELLQLPRRVEGRPLPPVEVHDLSTDLSKRGLPPLLSRPLRLAMETTLGKGEQVLLFLNRRGFHTHVSCPRCGFVLGCKRCDVSLIFHRASNVARCHYCGHEERPPEDCPSCGLPGIKYRGSGTERVEQEVASLFRGVSAARMDSDSMRGRGRYERTLEAFRDGKTRILLGTQMVVKGLDFPNVTLVGVINADTSIHMPDFRAAERTFQLLAQVAGRAGRGPKGGRVVVQTFAPEHPCIRDAARHDYEAFARRELQERRRYGYPPYMRLARLLFEGRNAGLTQGRCTAAVAAVRAAGYGKGVSVVGPAPAPIPRIKDRARWHALVKAPDAGALHAALAGLDRRRAEGVELTVDVDPVSLL